MVFLATFTILLGVTGCSKTNVQTSNELVVQPAATPVDALVSAEQAAQNALKTGDKMPLFELPDSKKNVVKSSELLKDSNLVVVFYRGGWCPFCNIYLKKLQDRLADIKAAGGELVAISAENPDDSLSTVEKDNLKFYVLSDAKLAFARKVGLVYQLPDKTDAKYKEMGIDLVGNNDMDKPELPVSATYAVNQNGEIVYAFVEPDYKQRAEPDIVIAELQKIKKAALK